MSADALTVVRSPRRWLAKRIWPNRDEAYSNAKHVDVDTVSLPGGLDDLAALLKRLLADPRAAVMRGELIDRRRSRGIRRLLHADPKTGDAATFRDVPRRWVALDIEGIARPAGVAVNDLAACAAIAIRHLPPAFATARCIVQASARHGIKPDIRLRLWFWLSRPTLGDELKRWLTGTPADPAVFSAVAPIYTSAPIFMEGMADPLPVRLAELPGADCVAVPPPAALAPPPTPPRALASERDPIPQASLDRFVDRVLERVRHAPEGQRHVSLRGAAVSLGGIQDRAKFTDAEASGWLLQALGVPASRTKDEGTIRWGLANGRARPIQLETPTRRTGPERLLASAKNDGKPKRRLAGEIERARRGVATTLPAYYPAPVEPRAAALERQGRIIHETIAEAARRAAARHEVRQRREAEIAALGVPGLALAPAAKAAITRRQHRAVAAEAGYGKRIPLPPRLLVTGSQGTGKTTSAIKAVAGIRERVTAWFSEQTLEKAEEVARDYARAAKRQPDALPGLVVRGRGQPDPARPGHTMCDRAEVARRVSQAGLSVRQSLCPTCPFRDACGYQRQARQIEATPHGVYFLASAYLFLFAPAPAPDILISDEAVTLTAIDRAEIPLAVLDPFLIPGLGSDTIDTLNTLRSILASGEPALRALRAARIDKAELTTVLHALKEVLQRMAPDIAGDMDDATIEAKLDASARGDILDARKVVSAVRREIEQPRDGLNGVTADRKTITVSRLRSPPGLKHAAVLALDGTGDEVLNRHLFGPALRHERITIERNAHVTGTIGKRYSRQSMTGVDAKGEPIVAKAASSARLRQEIGAIADALPGTTAVFSNQATIDGLIEDNTLSEHAPAGHFGALRGLNSWEGCRSALVAGQTSLRIGDVETLARAYMASDPAPFVSMDGPFAAEDAGWECQQWPYVATRMRRMRDGTRSAVVVAVHPDPRCQRVLEQVREAECVQAADRVRPVFNRRDLVLASNLCLDVSYDVIRTHHELVAGGNPLERAFAMTGVLPLNAEDLHRAHLGRFRSVRAAARALENYPPPAKRASLCEGGEVSYRTEGQRGPASRALIDRARHPDPLPALRQCLGGITEFQGAKLDKACLPPGCVPVRRQGDMPCGVPWPTAEPYRRPLAHAPPCD